VSHDLDLVATVCERGVLLEHGEIVMDGEVHDVVGELRRRSLAM
jgi:ABC-2 type transport system ATP-binding protein